MGSKKWGPSINCLAIKPIGGRLLVQPDPEEECINGILLTKAYYNGAWPATILDAGTAPPLSTEGPLKAGDRILFAQVAGERLVWNGLNVTIIIEEEIAGKLDD